jgi:phosphosulfolactate synthase
VDQIIAGVSYTDKLMWEAPIKNQQQYLILRFGNNVNLGNIPTTDILALEALRQGLRGDTLKRALARGR